MTISKQLRQEKRQARRDLSPIIQRQHAKQVLNQLKKQIFFRKSRHIALYLASDGELNPNEIARFARKYHKKLYLPVLHPFKPYHLWFCEWNQSPLKLNRFKILEPNSRNNPPISLIHLDLLFIPLTVFDQNHHRMGMGCGYYDRTLTSIRSHPLRPRFIGLAHACQATEQINPQPWDIPLDQIITELT